MKNIINIKAWNRPNILGKTLTKLSKCYNIENYDVMIVIDGPNDQSKISKFENEISHSLIRDNSKNIDVIYHTHNKGCAGNMKFCLNESFNDPNIDYIIHLEDDTTPARDFLLLMEWGYNHMKNNINIFAVCPFIRKIHLSEHNIHVELEKDIDKIIYRNNFEPGGGFGMNREQWEIIKNSRGVFGVIGECGNSLSGETWLNNLKIKGGRVTDNGSWAWPFRKMYLGNKKVIFPKISRTQNIGDTQGIFNPGPSWHKTKIYNPKWSDNEYYHNTDLQDINFQLLTN